MVVIATAVTAATTVAMVRGLIGFSRGFALLGLRVGSDASPQAASPKPS
jgi:hypothetical protein